MPDSKQVSTPKKSTAPTPGFLERMFGDESFSPEVQEGIRIAKQEMPNMAPVQPYGFFSRLVNPNANAYVAGGDNIYLNGRGNVGQSPQDVADTLTHEQTHVNQKVAENQGPFMNFMNAIFRRPQEQYSRRPEEMEAWQAEKDRRTRMGRAPTAVPSFSSGQFYVPQDTYLPSEKPKPILHPSVNKPVTMY